MPHAPMFLVTLIAAAAVGCTASSGRTYSTGLWKEGQPLGRVLVLVPQYSTDSSQQQDRRDTQIKIAIREALAQVPGTTVLDAQNPDGDGATPVSESKAVEAGRRSGAAPSASSRS